MYKILFLLLPMLLKQVFLIEKTVYKDFIFLEEEQEQEQEQEQASPLEQFLEDLMEILDPNGPIATPVATIGVLGKS